jgi:hypothetical protein
VGIEDPVPAQLLQFAGAPIRIAAQEVVDILNSPSGRSIVRKTCRRTDRQAAETILVLESQLPPPAEPRSFVDIVKFAFPPAMALNER